MIGEDGFSSGAGEAVNGAIGLEVFGADGGIVGEEEDAVWARPELTEGVFCFEDGWSVGPEAAEPETVDAAVDEMDLLACVED